MENGVYVENKRRTARRCAFARAVVQYTEIKCAKERFTMNPYEQRRRRVLDQLQFGEMMVLYSGESVASSMDEGFEF